MCSALKNLEISHQNEILSTEDRMNKYHEIFTQQNAARKNE